MDTVKLSSYSSKEKSSSTNKHSSSNSKSSSSIDSKKRSKHHRDRSSSEEREPLSKRKYDNNSDNDADSIHNNNNNNNRNSDSDHESSRKNSHHKRSSNKEEKSNKKHRNDDKPKSNKTEETSDTVTSSSAGGDISLSIEETNKLREKLGLKPLSVSENKSTSDSKSADGKKTYIDKDTNQEFEHVPAKNIAELKEQKSLREKLQEQKEKRQLVEKLRKAKGLADSDDEDNSAVGWLLKVKQKEEALKKAKLLEEMDAQLGQDDSETSVKRSAKPKDGRQKKYNENDLKGLRVEHDQSMIKEGQQVILTLKDRGILKGTGDFIDLDEDEEADVLVNVNIMDDEKAAKNIENKKKKPDYQAYDDFDEDGTFKERSILDKYNEELNGEKKKSFKLGTRGQYDASDDRFIEKLNQEHKARAIKIDALNELKFATDYMTQQEMEKFKKPKKIRRVLRKNKMMKADDLLSTAPEPIIPKSFKTESNDQFHIKKEPVETTASKAHKDNKISLKDIDFGFKNDSENEEGEYKDDEEEDEDEDDDIDVKKLKENELDELKQILEEENNTLEELHSVLSKTRKRVTSSILNSNNIIKHEIDDQNESKTNGIVFENLNTVVEYNEDDLKNSLTLDTMSEFCRNLGGTSDTKATIERQRQTADDDDDDEDEETKMEIERLKPKKSKKSHSHGNGKKNEDESSEEETEEGEKSKTKEMEVDDDDKDVNESGEGFDLLDEEPVIDRGLASCLKLAFNKGYIEQEKGKQNARFNKANIEAVNFTVEEKNYYDIDDKYNRNRDRFSGPLSDFQEKSNYKPNVKLDYIDEKGHAMNEKEAFRYLSHKFHGKGSGKKKTEKQNKKIKETEAMNKMSSIDTPLNTVALLVEKQKKLQQPFVVLSAAKNKQDQVTLHKR